MTSTETETERQLELRTFGRVVGKVAVDVQKALIASGFYDQAQDFNSRLSKAVYKSREDLESSLEVLSFYTGRDWSSEPTETQVKVIERFITAKQGTLQAFLEGKYREFLSAGTMNSGRKRGPSPRIAWRNFLRTFRGLKAEVKENSGGGYKFVVPELPYKLATIVEIPWGEPAQIAGRKLGVLKEDESLEELAAISVDHLNGSGEDLSRRPRAQGYSFPTRHEQIGAGIILRSKVTIKPRFVLIIPSRVMIATSRHDNEVVNV